MSTSGHALPFIVSGGIRASQLLGVTRINNNGNGLGFCARVVCAADRDNTTGLILGLDTTGTLDAQTLREIGVCKLELSARAFKTSNRLTSGALCAWPLRFEIAWRASIGAHGAVNAPVTRNTGDDILDEIVGNGDLLNANPAIVAKIINRDCTIFGGESGAVKHAIWKLRVDTFATRIALVGGGSS